MKKTTRKPAATVKSLRKELAAEVIAHDAFKNSVRAFVLATQTLRTYNPTWLCLNQRRPND